MSKIIQDISLNDNLTHIPRKLLKLSSSVKAGSRFLPPLEPNIFYIANRGSFPSHISNIGEDNFSQQPDSSQSDLLNIEIASK